MNRIESIHFYHCWYCGRFCRLDLVRTSDQLPLVWFCRNCNTSFTVASPDIPPALHRTFSSNIG